MVSPVSGLLLTFILAFVVSLAALPIIIKVVIRKGLVDRPDGARKIHVRTVPTLGGIAIFAGLFFAWSVGGSLIGTTPSVLVLCGLMLLLLTGVKDDLMHIPAKHKIWLQLGAAVLAMVGGDAVVMDFGGMFGFDAVYPPVGVAITLFTFVVVINAYNLIDGLDGLAGGIGIVASTAFALIFAANEAWLYALGATALSGALLGFLTLNFHPARVFMGDTGSLIVGYTLAFFAVKYQVIAAAGPQSTINASAAAIVVAILMVPLYDTLRVFAARKARGESPFTPSREHAHHVLLEYVMDQRFVALYLYVAAAAIAGASVTMAYLGLNVTLNLVISILFAALILPLRSDRIALLQLAGLRNERPTAIRSVPPRTSEKDPSASTPSMN
jgi:UDP-N-acetylmuramyl pentapeptide phosphotransferase/UDP-N-acetylglucosamine-1-phosphate transferase